MGKFKPPNTIEEFTELVGDIRGGEVYKDPAAFAFGLATVEKDPETGDSRVIEAQLTRRNYGKSQGVAAIMAFVLGHEHDGLQTGEYLIGGDMIRQALGYFTPYMELVRGIIDMEHLRRHHANIHTLKLLEKHNYKHNNVPPGSKVAELINDLHPVMAVVRDWDHEPVSVGDAMLRLYARSEDSSMTSAFFKQEAIAGIMPQVVTTEHHGVFTPERWAEVSERIALAGLSTAVRSVGNEPDKLDYLALQPGIAQDYRRPKLGE